MKKFLFLAFVAFPVLASGQFRDSYYRELAGNDVVDSFETQVRYLASEDMMGRKFGSEGEAAAARYMARQFLDYGLDLMCPDDGDAFGLKMENGDTLTSHNVIAFISGYDKELKDEFIVIGARLDNLGSSTVVVDGKPVEKIFYGANGNASGLSMLLQLAKRMSEYRVLLKRTVIFAAFGSSLEGGAGAWYFLNRTFGAVDKIAAMVNLDMVGTLSTGFYAYTNGSYDLGHLLVDENSELQPVKPQLVAIEPVASDHRMFYAKDIPFVLFTTGMYPEYNTDRDVPSIVEYEDMERELEYIYKFTLDLSNGPRPQFRSSPPPSASSDDDEEVVPYHECDIPPAFINSTDPAKFMNEWVYKYLKYPPEAVRQGIQGKVLIGFTVDKKGKVGDVRVLRGVHPLLDAEALRVVSISPDWKAARKRGKKVKSELSVYVEFRLERK